MYTRKENSQDALSLSFVRDQPCPELVSGFTAIDQPCPELVSGLSIFNPIDPIVQFNIMAKQSQRPTQQSQQARKPAPAPARRSSEKKETIFSSGSKDLIFGRQNFILMGIGLALVLAGLVAMSGGAMPDPSKWEPERIYSPMRITIAPILMVAGFVTVIFGIFKSKPAASGATAEETEA
jgi:hypothetical protein